jgi:hypothetical protein
MQNAEFRMQTTIAIRHDGWLARAACILHPEF